MNRTELDLDKVATGEHWLAKDAFELKLVDELLTSDEYLMRKIAQYHAFKLSIAPRVSVINKLLKPAMRYLSIWG